MNTTDSKGNELQIGSIVEMKGTGIKRVVIEHDLGWVLSDGRIRTKQITGKLIGDTKWIDPKKCVLAA